MYHLFCGFKNAQAAVRMCFTEEGFFKMLLNIYRKIRVPESIFNKVKLAALVTLIRLGFLRVSFF